jgi:hypothetical protein
MQGDAYLLSDESISSTASHAIRASGDAAPNFLLASMASLIKPEESTRVAKRELDRTPKVGEGAKALAEAAKRATVARVNFMVVDRLFVGVKIFFYDKIWNCFNL